MDKITVLGIEVAACHGVLDFERVTPQPFIIDLELEGHFAGADTDELADTADYGRATVIARRVALENSFFLIERLAAAVGDAILAEFAPLCAVTVTVHKPKAPVEGAFSDIFVSITRRRP